MCIVVGDHLCNLWSRLHEATHPRTLMPSLSIHDHMKCGSHGSTHGRRHGRAGLIGEKVMAVAITHCLTRVLMRYTVGTVFSNCIPYHRRPSTAASRCTAERSTGLRAWC